MHGVRTRRRAEIVGVLFHHDRRVLAAEDGLDQRDGDNAARRRRAVVDDSDDGKGACAGSSRAYFTLGVLSPGLTGMCRV